MILVCAVIFPLHPNHIPDRPLNAALTATSSPPARWAAFLSGIATRLETTTSCANSELRGSLIPPKSAGPSNMLRRALSTADAVPLRRHVARRGRFQASSPPERHQSREIVPL